MFARPDVADHSGPLPPRGRRSGISSPLALLVESPMSRCRVLVVEDEMLVAAMLEEILETMGYEVIGPVGRLQGALSLAKTAEIDAALLDLNLHGESAYPVAQVLMERGVPCVLLTGCGGDGIPSAYRDWTVLTKPFPTRALLDALRALVRPTASAPAVP